MLVGSVITTERRYVALPWDTRGSAARTVGNEADVQPDPVAVEMYQREFPDRFVRWDPRVQLFGIYQQAESLDHEPKLIEWVFHWEIQLEDGDETEYSDEQVAAMIDARDPRMRRAFMHFDEPFVRRRLLERIRFLDLGPNKYQQRIRDRNAARQASLRRKHSSDMAAAAGEMRRWIPVIEEFERTGRLNTGMRTPYHRVGIDLKQKTA